MFNTVYETNDHWAVSVCSYCFCGFMHPRIRWDPVSFVCPGAKLFARSVIQAMSTLPLGSATHLDLDSVLNLMWNWATHSYCLHGRDPPNQFFKYYFYSSRWPLLGKGGKPVFTAKPGQTYSYKCWRKHKDSTQPQRAVRELTQP